MDASQHTQLREWATRLEAGVSEELRAAGRAIRMLVDEVESLEGRLARSQTSAGDAPAPPPATAPPPEEPAQDKDDLGAWDHDPYQGSFFSRLKKTFGLD
jgi:hypothetical protein